MKSTQGAIETTNARPAKEVEPTKWRNMFDGEQVIKPEELHPLDTTAIALPFGDDSPSKPVQKYRDVLKCIAAM